MMVLHMLFTPRKFLMLLCAGAVVLVWISASLFSDIATISGAEVLSRDVLMHSRGKTPPFPGDQTSHLHWFVQISDIHISRYRWKSITQDLHKFCSEYLDIIKPKVTVVSGDLTDARDFSWHSSSQKVFEWKVYNSILQHANVRNKTVWLDIRGNHDAFSVPSWSSSENMYRKFSIQGQQGLTYKYTYQSPDGDKCTFIAFDATPSPGPKRPYNFFGSMTQEVMDALEDHLTASQTSNVTILFGHYPSSVLGSGRMKQLMSRCLVYLCGHLHTFLDLIPKMYTRQRSGNMELELGDWKKSRRYRVFAVDHDLFSFVDKTFGSWPVVLITNPKHAQFNVPLHEPLGRMARSTHIRILVFSNVTTRSVRITIDNVNIGDAYHVDGPLYVLPWKPSNYATGIHQMEVEVTDSQGQTYVEQQPFCLHGQCDIGFPLLARVALMTDMLKLVKLLFWTMFVITLLPLILFKLMYRRLLVVVSGTWRNSLARCLQTLLRWAYLLGSTDSVIYPLIAFNIYIAVGPWFVGELLDGYIGVCFVFGMFVNSTFIPGALTYISGFLQLILINIPLSLYLGHCLDLAVSKHRRPLPRKPLLTWIQHHFIFFWILSWLTYAAFVIPFLAYGFIAGVLCPIYTWAFPFVVYMRWLALRKGEIGVPFEELPQEAEKPSAGETTQ
ncbi:Transmembrane protein 62 [Lamellibrachia satsuma]|nr:Transmembrane protein 62 [Lamellibrachia satsuma]